ncbi:hypothetical protein [Methylomonas methanica]|jgi:hypothetical protein|uniref:Ead/Ea22-like family protein n=1 Tax=Methylomonas methanica TaxID=421 RepID=A0A177M736_METMH|nr:hypothetical protein [Methylomonas methanica]OAI01502.1 hypothetical protein A1332_17670 [Methylomonas methanica]
MSTQSNDLLTDEELLAIKMRSEQATPQPWKAYVEGRDFLGGDSFIQTGGEDIYLTPGASVADHDFIAHARQDIPRLIAEVERLRKML